MSHKRLRDLLPICGVAIGALLLPWSPASAQTVSQFYTATNSGLNDVVVGSNGTFYGLGGNASCSNAFNSIFQLSTTAQFSVLVCFPQTSQATLPAGPIEGFAQGSDGNFYGTSQATNPETTWTVPPPGDVFQATPSGGITVLHQFAVAGTSTTGDGQILGSGAVAANSSGTIFGITDFGGDGTNTGCEQNADYTGCGTVWSIQTNGSNYSVLHRFERSVDGYWPFGNVLIASDGSVNGLVYGPTSTPALWHLAGSTFTEWVLVAGTPVQVLQGADGNYYVLFSTGGSTSCQGSACGQLVKVTPSGVITVISNQVPAPTSMLQGSDGNFYISTRVGTLQDYLTGGAIYEVTPSGTTSRVILFAAPTDPSDPIQLLEYSNGTITGVATGVGGWVSGSSSLANVFTVCTTCAGPAVPPTPTNVVVTPNASNGTVSISWTGGLPATGYQILITNASGSTYYPLADVSNFPTYNSGQLGTAGSTVYISIVSTDSAGASAPSAPTAVVLPPQPIPTLPEWGVILMVSLLALYGLRRSRVQAPPRTAAA